MDWFAAFGVCLSWVSDQGTHFKNEVIQSLQHALGAHHHFTTARCPCANGTVEVVMREALRSHTPAKSLANHAPVTVMTGLSAMSPLDAISLPTPLEATTLSELMATREALFTTLRSALDNMHKTVAKASQAARSKGRRNARSTGVKMAQYAIGDYVPYADVWAHTRAKLRVKWCGPAQVVNAVSSWIFMVENLLSGDERDVHASRLKFYSDDTLDVTEDLLSHIDHNSEGHVVSGLLDTRYSEADKRFENLVTWRGLSKAEDSWEPATTLLEDVPVKGFIRVHRRTANFKRLATGLNVQGLLKD
ncbi:Chromodomain protein [Phytophthora megakarya]|uniref:Chromodomain protein n=1 Tax=Phytophthora megakarya TaxID=4795 RepID=A0A225WYA9_9STRA|nr:Chromodomain protein [Phytophthora megakarya]